MIHTETIIEDVAPADHMPGPPQGSWTYQDYAAIPDDGHRYEVLDGVLYMMTCPGEPHQSALTWLVYYLTMYIQAPGHGRVYAAPFDVELAIHTIPQPDVIVVLNHSRHIITPSHIVGAPDLVVEIASPNTARHDRTRKQAAYARAGIPEYWIAEPNQRTIEVLILDASAYRSAGVYEGHQRLPSRVVPELPVSVEQFFA